MFTVFTNFNPASSLLQCFCVCCSWSSSSYPLFAYGLHVVLWTQLLLLLSEKTNPFNPSPPVCHPALCCLLTLPNEQHESRETGWVGLSVHSVRHTLSDICSACVDFQRQTTHAFTLILLYFGVLAICSIYFI